MKIIYTLFSVLVIGVIFVLGFVYSGLYDVSAGSHHSGITQWLMSTTMHASVERRAREINVPNLDDKSLQQAGISDFDAMCAACHGAPGQKPAAIGQGLNPPAPDLKESAAHRTVAELFWITKNGIKMSGMPAWGASHDDAALWPVVAFITVLPRLDADAYQAMLTSAGSEGHHASDHASENTPDTSTETTVDEVTGHQHENHSHGKQASADDKDNY